MESQSHGFTAEYDPDIEVSYGYWKCPVCGIRAFGGGPMPHKAGCNVLGYDGIIYCYSPKELKSLGERKRPPNAPMRLLEVWLETA